MIIDNYWGWKIKVALGGEDGELFTEELILVDDSDLDDAKEVLDLISDFVQEKYKTYKMVKIKEVTELKGPEVLVVCSDPE